MAEKLKVEELLRKYKYDKARVSFLKCQMERFTPETHNDYIECKMFEPGFGGSTPRFIMEGGREVAALNKVEETAQEYRVKCEKEYENARAETQREIKELAYRIAIVEDALHMLEGINGKFRVIIESYYIYGTRMEDVADSIHVSRSRCYEMCKEGIKLMTRLIYGDRPDDRMRPSAS